MLIYLGTTDLKELLMRDTGGWRDRGLMLSLERLQGGIRRELEVDSQRQQVLENEEFVLKFISFEDVVKRFQNAFVGRVSILGSIGGLPTKLEMEGYFNINVSPLGKSWCILEESEAGNIKNLIVEGESWWTNCFEEVQRWEEGFNGRGRFV